MMYEEFQERTDRKDITFSMYNDAIEPLYMVGKFDKDEFCKMVKKVPIEMIPILTEEYALKRKMEDMLNTMAEDVAEKAKQVDSAETARREAAADHNRAKLKYRRLELAVMFDTNATARDLRAENFEDFPVLQREAQDMGIIAK